MELEHERARTKPTAADKPRVPGLYWVRVAACGHRASKEVGGTSSHSYSTWEPATCDADRPVEISWEVALVDPGSPYYEIVESDEIIPWDGKTNVVIEVGPRLFAPDDSARPRCETCRWWEYRGAEAGFCLATRTEHKPDTRAVNAEDLPRALVTYADFGCVQWEGKGE
jgi:hypothetical protein